MRIIIAVVIVMVISFIAWALLMHGAEGRIDPEMKRKDLEQMQSLGIDEGNEDEEILRQ